MRIAVHAKVLSETQLNGIGVYSYNILKALAKIDTQNEYVIYTNVPLAHPVEAPNFKIKRLRFPKFWSFLRLPFEFIGGRYDLLFVTKEFVPFPFKPKTVITVHDLMGLIFPERISLNGKIHFWLTTHYFIPAADAILSVSGETKRNILKHCRVDPGKITITHLGYDQEIFHSRWAEEKLGSIRRKYGLDCPYFINTSSLLWYRKNLLRIIEAFSSLERKTPANPMKLVITGKRGESYQEIIDLIAKLNLGGKVILTGYIPLEDMPVLLAGAEGLVFPSLDEGFGLPLIEAMACGCPVISSNVSAIPEVVGDAGYLVDPLQSAAIEEAMRRLVEEPGEKERLRRLGLERAKEFSWEKAARQTLDVFEKVAKAGKS
jgi:glycosyltransferase involved in cell wall biosynthesis